MQPMCKKKLGRHLTFSIEATLHITLSDLLSESRCFGKFCDVVFLVPHNSFWNSTPFSSKIISKGQFKVKIKGQNKLFFLQLFYKTLNFSAGVKLFCFMYWLIWIKWWKVYAYYLFFPQENRCFARKTDQLRKE